MRKPTSVSEISAGELAKLVGLTVRWLKQLADVGSLPPAVRGKYPMPDVIRALVDYYRGEAKNAKLDPLKAVRRELLEDKLKLSRKELLVASEVRVECTRTTAQAKARLLAIPGQLVVRYGVGAKVVEGTEAMIKDACRELQTRWEK